MRAHGAADWRDPPANTGTPSRLLRVHQHKENTTRLLAAIDPGVVGRLLYDHVARLQTHVAVIEHHVDLAGENDRVVETAGAMHQRMLHRNAARRRIG